MFVSLVAYDDLRGFEDAADRQDYLMWGFSARRERFGVAPGAEKLQGSELKRVVERLTTDWHQDLQRMVQDTDPATVTSFPVKTSTPVKPWKTRNVTLLGDALHNMPPYRGVGANTALWDAALLRETIVDATQERPLVERLAAYERQMINHGFRAVRTSLAAMEQFHAEALFRRTLTKAFLRTLDRVPALQTVMMHAR